MRPTKVVPVVTTGYTRKFFMLALDDFDPAERDHLAISGYSDALFALQLGDRGLDGMSVHPGDYLLFATGGPLRSAGQIALVRQEEEYIIREAYWSGDMTQLRVPGDRYETMELPTENIRITAILRDVIRNNELAPIVRFG